MATAINPGQASPLAIAQLRSNLNVRPEVVKNTAGAADISRISPEARLQQAGETFGASLGALSPEQKKDMMTLHARINAWADQQEQQGRVVDRSSIFAAEAAGYAAAGLDKNPNDKGLSGLFQAGVGYVDAVRAHQLAEQGGQK